MFHFTGYGSYGPMNSAHCIQILLWMGSPFDIHDQSVLALPWLIATYYVLLRLIVAKAFTLRS